MKTKHFPLFSTAFAASFILASPSARAAAITWDAGGGDKNWSTLPNWSDDAAPTGDDVTFNASGALASGTTNTVSASESIASLSYSFEDAANQHTTDIAAGQTLSVAGNFSVLTGTAPAAPTNVSITGSTGTLDMAGTSFLLGNPTQTTTTTTSTLDMSGLGTLAANFSNVFRVGGGGSGGNTTGNIFTLKLPVNSTITAATVGVSDFSNFSTLQKMLLGSGASIISTDNLKVGNSVAGRSGGELSFNTGTGTLLLRGLAGGASAVTTMNMVSASSNTSSSLISVVNLADHNVDAKITTLTMARRTGTGSSASGFVSQATLTFNQGGLEVGTANMGKNGNAALIGKIDATINIGGGTASFGAINMADNTGGDTTKVITANLNLTAGTTTVAGDIVRLGGTNATAKVLLSGGTLDMTAGNIGDGTKPVTLVLESGTLQNVAQVNGGADLAKTTSGNLVLTGNNTFTGGMNMFGGEVKITSSGSFGSGAKNLNIQNAAYVNLDGTAGDITLPSNITMSTAGLAFLNTAGNNTINGAVSIITGNATTTVTSDGGSLTLNGAIAPGATVATQRNLQLTGTSTGSNIVSGAVTDGALTTLTLVKSGTGNWSLTNTANTYSGNATVNAGILTLGGAAGPLNANTGNDASTVTIAATGATLNLTYTGTDKVDKLFIGGVQQAAGVYGPTGINIPQITNSSGSGTLTVATGPAGYPAWASLNGASPNLNEDHDNDGVDNGAEYFIGGPAGNTTGFTPLPGVANTAGILSVTWTKAASYTGAYGTDFVVETSSTLDGVWAAETLGGTVIITGNDVKYTFPAGTKNFARLKVTGP